MHWKHRTLWRYAAPLFCSILIALAPAGSVFGANAEPSRAAGAAHVATALAELQGWLGDGSNGRRWNAYLLHDVLREQLEAEDPDPAKINQVLNRYRSSVQGLALRPFVAVREALTDWQRQLKASRAGDDLAGLATASAGDFQPVTAADEQAARQAVRDRAAQLVRYLGPQAAGWQDYIGWESLKPVLEADDLPTRRQLAGLAVANARLYANQPGLERREFRRFRESLDEYRAIAPWHMAAAAGGDPTGSYERALRGLAVQLERLQEKRTSETPWLTGQALGTIDALGDSPDLVAAVRAALAQPNLHANVSGDFVNAIPRDPVDTIRPVDQCILGTRILGRSRTLASVRFEPVPWPDAIALVARFQGNAYAQTRGYHDPVRIRSSSTTALSAVKRIHFNDAGFVTGAAVADAETRSRIHSIQKTGGQFGHRLVERIAWKRAGETKPRSERVGARNAAGTLSENFDVELAAAVAEGRANYEDKVRAPLVRRGFFPEILRMSSTANDLQIVTTLARRDQLGADGPPPPQPSGSDLSLRLHESAVDNYLAVALGGVTLSQDDADAPLKITGNAPAWLEKAATTKPPKPPADANGPALGRDEDDPPFRPWSLTLNSTAPVGVTFDANELHVRLRAAVLASDEDEYRNWDIIIRYRVTRQGDRIVLVRTGDIEALPTGFDPSWDTRMAARDSAFRNTLAGNMTARAAAGQGFPARIDIPPIDISGLGRLRLAELRSQAHWLTLAWRLP